MTHQKWETIYELVRSVPLGRVTTYGAICRYLPGTSAREIGWALRQSFSAEPPVPAHRVVNRMGELSGRLHFHPPELMGELLRSEGVAVEQERVQDFERLFWDPNSEL